MKKFALACLSVLLLNACSSAKEQDTSMYSAEELYRQGYEYMQQTSWNRAAETFEKVEIEHPYSRWAVKAKLMGAYAYYRDEKYDDAIISLDRFIKFHPGNKDAAYAYYMKGLCYYDQISAADKDQSNTYKADAAFKQLIALFPNSEYAADARRKLNLITDHQAGQEMSVGRYYLKQQNYLSALNRFNVVVEKYQTTPQIEEALYRQVEIYTILGIKNQAEKSAAVLKHNYPSSSWTAKAEKLLH